jgi:hypothetical protein
VFVISFDFGRDHDPVACQFIIDRSSHLPLIVGRWFVPLG